MKRAASNIKRLGSRLARQTLDALMHHCPCQDQKALSSCVLIGHSTTQEFESLVTPWCVRARPLPHATSQPLTGYANVCVGISPITSRSEWTPARREGPGVGQDEFLKPLCSSEFINTRARHRLGPFVAGVGRATIDVWSNLAAAREGPCNPPCKRSNPLKENHRQRETARRAKCIPHRESQEYPELARGENLTNPHLGLDKGG